MSILSLDIKYNKNSGLVLSSSELQALYLYGIRIQDRSGKDLPEETFNFFIASAQAEIEKYLGIKLIKQIYTESLDFYVDEFKSFGFIQTTYPVVKPFSLTGYLGQVKQIEYPKQWLSSRLTSDRETYYRRIFIVPTQTATVQTSGVSILYSGVMPNIGMLGFNTIPNYWSVEYCTGFDTIPRDIVDVVGKIATIAILNIAGDIALGQAALANYSLSLDGLSQSIGTTSSATNAAYGARILTYYKEIKDALSKLKPYYRGIGVASM